jgi:hypothetical protein
VGGSSYYHRKVDLRKNKRQEKRRRIESESNEEQVKESKIKEEKESLTSTK